jgi:uncharacterized protein
MVLPRSVIAIFILLASTFLAWAEPLPPVPEKYFTDQCGLVTAAEASAFNEQLAQFERASSNQLIVYVADKIPDGREVDEYTTALMHAWRLGQKGKDNGIGLFVFPGSKRISLRTGYGLEGAVPDMVCKSITDDTFRPLYRAGQYRQAFADTIARTIQIINKPGDYQGSGQTARESKGSGMSSRDANALVQVLFGFAGIVVVAAIMVTLAVKSSSRGRGQRYGRSSRGKPQAKTSLKKWLWTAYLACLILVASAYTFMIVHRPVGGAHQQSMLELFITISLFILAFPVGIALFLGILAAVGYIGVTIEKALPAKYRSRDRRGGPDNYDSYGGGSSSSSSGSDSGFSGGGGDSGGGGSSSDL